MIAMILAAGRGERLRPLSDELPKALVEVRQQSLIERHLRSIRAAGIDTVVINLGWLGDQIVERLGSGVRYGLRIIYSPEDGGRLETGGGIRRALPILGDAPFLVVNGDIYTDMPLPGAALAPDTLGHLVLVPRPAHRHRGDFDLVSGRVRNAEVPTLTFSGIAIYQPAFFDGCEPGRFLLAPMLRQAADAGQLTGSEYRGVWHDVGTPERLALLNRE